MLNFLKTRSKFQWLAAIGWVIGIGMISYIDIRQGKIMVGVLEAFAYFVMFCAAAYMGHKGVLKRL